MKRPYLVWLVFVACGAIGLGVLGWFTREMLRLDRETTEGRRLAAAEENIRLALWRMDSSLAAVHGLEAARPGQEYESFFRAESAFTPGLTPLPVGTVLQPSPLLAYTPPFVKLHFQIEPDGTVHSPQSPVGAWRAAALATGVPAERLDAAALALDELRGDLVGTQLAAMLPPVPVAPLESSAAPQKDQGAAEISPVQALVDKINRRRVDQESDALSAAPPAEANETANPGPATAAPAPRQELQQQHAKNAAEEAERSNLLYASNELNADNASRRRAQSPPVATNNPAPAPGSTGASADLRTGSAPAPFARAVVPPRSSSASPPTSAPTTAGVVVATGEANAAPRDREAVKVEATPPPPDVVADAREIAAEPAEAAGAAPTAARPIATGDEYASAEAGVEGPLQAVWAGEELVFARRALVQGHEVVQGAWLDWPELQAWLLSRVGDLLPDARMEPVRPGQSTTGTDATRRLAFLPVRLVPGVVPVDTSSLASPLRISLGAAWIFAVAGVAALALMLHGTLRLSERRGAFVSAVTHELRTPLTTFRMYTEMLASGMVTDETKRRSYVDTLRTESERLSHLVENVLSYARLERGRAAARVEDTTPGALLARIEERLRQRAQQGGLGVVVEIADDVAGVPLRTDTTAVEQVLFNLVDNATKYGRPQNGGGEIAIGIARLSQQRLAMRVSDSGPGLTSAARKRLFQPFSKSATEAAHTQPGVGLGLALCRRLARDELHGDLILERSGPDGTAFRLELPLG